MALDKTTALHGLTTDKHMTTDEEQLTRAELDAIAALRAKGASGEITWEQANRQANAIRSRHGYAIDQTGEVTATAPDLADALENWHAETKAAQEAKIDAATEQAEAELEQTLADAAVEAKAARAAIDLEEAKAKDDQALYAHLRGDSGGIGQAQYDAISAAAMENRAALRAAQTRLAADTAREMAQLRAKGEYEKAQAQLDLAQEYLARLQELKEWEAEHALSVEKFSASLRQWEAEYALSAAKGKTASAASSAPAAKMDIEGLFRAAQTMGGYSWLKQKSVYTQYGLESAPNKSDYDLWLSRNDFSGQKVSAIAKGWATDLFKMYTDPAQRRAAIEQEYAIPDGWMTETDYRYLMSKVG